jgi:primosomal protein N' (replication factor Y)
MALPCCRRCPRLIRIEDLPGGRWVSPSCKKWFKQGWNRRAVVAVLNRRGYAPVTICRACGHQIGCDDCDDDDGGTPVLKRLMCHQWETSPCQRCARLAKPWIAWPWLVPVWNAWPKKPKRCFGCARRGFEFSLYGSAGGAEGTYQSIARGEADVIVGTQLVARGIIFQS